MNKFYVVCNTYYPNTAFSNRVFSFLRGFSELGVDAEVVFISQSYMENLKIRNEFAISETVIVGDTPDYLYPKVN